MPTSQAQLSSAQGPVMPRNLCELCGWQAAGGPGFLSRAPYRLLHDYSGLHVRMEGTSVGETPGVRKVVPPRFVWLDGS